MSHSGSNRRVGDRRVKIVPVDADRRQGERRVAPDDAGADVITHDGPARSAAGVRPGSDHLGALDHEVTPTAPGEDDPERETLGG